MTKTVTLMNFDDTHFEQTYVWLQDPGLRAAIDCSAAPTRDQNQQYWQNRLRNDDNKSFAIVEATVGHVGNCGLVKISKTESHAELWIYLGQIHGMGLGGRAMTELLDYGFNEAALNFIYLRVVKSNPGAAKFYKTFGFRRCTQILPEKISPVRDNHSDWYRLASDEFAA